MNELSARLQVIRDRIHTAAVRCGRDPATVELLAVSKTHPVEVIREAVEAGQLLFGENKVQEILAKAPQLPAELHWHLIGHLQSNKVRKVLPLVKAIHSIDSLDLARDVNRIATELGLTAKVYLEVNLAEESTKHGFKVEDLRASLEALHGLDRLNIQGLMCIPPFEADAELSRPYFTRLRELRDELEKSGGKPLPLLSMGMSHDFEIAIEEGSTLVRVGTAIFGERPRKEG
jgi:pyridoxal phosphate enzyme (YggS family)|uniref:YggS family pyridoxal phosphate-dependent enzyme n=1 Tax=Prosthecobacter sp. TaxID=1965333 RepID=UPI0037849E6A